MPVTSRRRRARTNSDLRPACVSRPPCSPVGGVKRGDLTCCGETTDGSTNAGTVVGVTGHEAASGRGDYPDDPAVPAVPGPSRPDVPLAEAAPWLIAPSAWSIGERAGFDVRPGMFIYTRGTRSFVIVAEVTHVATAAGVVSLTWPTAGRSPSTKPPPSTPVSRAEPSPGRAVHDAMGTSSDDRRNDAGWTVRPPRRR